MCDLSLVWMEQMHSLTSILKRDGRKEPYDRGKITMATWQSLWAVADVKRRFPELTDTDEIARRAADIEVPHEKADKRSALWKEAEHLARLVEDALTRSNGSHLWKVEEIQDIREQTLLAAGYEAAAKAYIFYRNKKAARRKTQEIPGMVRNDLAMSENALAAMARRYLRKDKEGNVVETPLAAMKRVATAVASKENIQIYKHTNIQKNEQTDRPKKSNNSGKQWRDRYLEIMNDFEFVPAGCYFRGAGNKQNGSLANCFVLPVEDSIEQIFDAVKWSALIHQMGGGTGFNFSHLRPRGDVVGSGGLSSGPINFMKAFDAETQIVMQGGEHRGANMGILNIDHPDIFEFIRAKSVDGEISNFNVSVGVFDQFMEAVEKDREWSLVNPRDTAVTQKIAAQALWDELIRIAHATGDPGMIYLDTINQANPVMEILGPIESTNVCGEQPLHPFDVCNLGSINLSKFVKLPFWEQNSKLKTQNSKRQLKDLNPQTNVRWKRLEEVVRIAVRFLDDGIDVSTYPIPQIDEMAHKLRRIGLGVMGWADMLVKLGIPYSSDEGVQLAEKIMKFIQEISWDESERLAKEKGEFPLWKGSYFNGVKNPFCRGRRVRNVAVTTIAPTGTISMVADCSSGIEPYFALEYTKNVVARQGLRYVNQYYEDAQRKLKTQNSKLKSTTQNLKLDEIFRTAHEISPEWHVRMQAAFQKYTDNAVSKTINFPRSATVKDVENAYMLAWKLGCKGITVYRDGSRSYQILNQTTDYRRSSRGLSPEGLQTTAMQISGRRQLAVDGKPAAQRLMQSQLQITPLSQRAYQVERLALVEESVDGHCPECGAVMEQVEGCATCRNCGYSRCSI